ncbi:MAG: hypothetical protein WAV09_02620 [Minisyncoccia bacterium]
MNPELNIFRPNTETDPKAIEGLIANKRATLEGEALADFDQQLASKEREYNEKLTKIESTDTFTRVTEVSAINMWYQSEVRAMCE